MVSQLCCASFLFYSAFFYSNAFDPSLDQQKAVDDDDLTSVQCLAANSYNMSITISHVDNVQVPSSSSPVSSSSGSAMLESCEKLQSDDKTMQRQRAFSDEELMFVPSPSTAPFTRDLAFSTSAPFNDSSAQPNSTLLLSLDPTVTEPELVSSLTNFLPTDEYILYSRMFPCACIFCANSDYARTMFIR